MARSLRSVWNATGVIDWWLYLVPILLTIFGVIVIASITLTSSLHSLAFGQALYALIGLIAMLVITRVDYRNWRGAAPAIYVAVVGLLVMVEAFGVSVFGARRWLSIFGFQLQPSELAKVGLVLVLARFFADHEEFKFKDYVQLATLVGVPMLLVLRQPDLGTTIVLFLSSIALLIAGGVPRKFLIGLLIAGMLALPVGWHFLADYQRTRVETFLDPAKDPYGSGYNVLQALIAVGAGGLKGEGLGQGTQAQHQFLPVAHTDFIFAGVAESTGFLGSILLIILEAFMLFRLIRATQVARDRFGFLIGVGLTTMLLSQVGINIAMNLGLAPVTGIPLPFVSHGGTALIVNFIAIGIMQSVVVRHKRMTF